jgi:hypothetical protein
VAADDWLGVTAFVPEGSDYTPVVFVERLREALPGCEVSIHPHGVEVTRNGWQLWLYESLARSGDPNWSEFAESFREHPRWAEMAAPGRRLEFAGRNADAGDDGGAAVATVAVVLTSFHGVFVFDAEAEDEL